MLGSLETTRSPHRDRGLLLLSMQAGLRAKAIASLTWVMVTEVHGQIAEALQVQNRASKGKPGGRGSPPSAPGLGNPEAGASQYDDPHPGVTQ